MMESRPAAEKKTSGRLKAGQVLGNRLRCLHKSTVSVNDPDKRFPQTLINGMCAAGTIIINTVDKVKRWTATTGSSRLYGRFKATASVTCTNK